MKRTGNYGNRRQPSKSPSKLVNQMFDATDNAGLYVKEVAEMLNLTQHSPTRWRCGTHVPPLVHVEKVLDKLGYDIVVVKREAAE